MELNFNNTETAFKSKTNRDLKRALWLFRSLASPRLVRIATWMTNTALRLKVPVNWLIKPTIYRHFVGGETLEECAGTVARHKEFNVCSILDYSVEGSHDEKSMQETLLETLKSIRNAAGETGIPFAVFKPTAFAVPELFNNAEPGRPLEGQMENEYYRFRSRVNVLCNEAFKLDVPLMIDAEDSWYQHLVDDTTEEMMRRYNREKAIVFNTLQMYRHDRIQFLKDSIANAREGNYFLGVKLVRGAYMEKERERAKAKGYPSPIHPDKAATDAAFDEAIRISLDNSDIVSVFCGSHNETSNLLMAQEILKRELPVNDNRFWFAQLYGMSDHISFNLANSGFNVAKYVPYGPVKNVMPYLFRRAEENTSIAGQTSRELRLLKTEIGRRNSTR
ncbi:L-proline dehydrogenase [Lentimicrobium saccharophilum]|uniref:L-proline dehydrogenase n=2 Tax=Lentimicrobium saccharophilum TaxID=1678841 RepID=A0A0S7BY14_9BACT|nr:L-proline dehydrogenase [Lentimicrobium saccharophilum]